MPINFPNTVYTQAKAAAANPRIPEKEAILDVAGLPTDFFSDEDYNKTFDELRYMAAREVMRLAGLPEAEQRALLNGDFAEPTKIVEGIYDDQLVKIVKRVKTGLRYFSDDLITAAAKGDLLTTSSFDVPSLVLRAFGYLPEIAVEEAIEALKAGSYVYATQPVAKKLLASIPETDRAAMRHQVVTGEKLILDSFVRAKLSATTVGEYLGVEVGNELVRVPRGYEYDEFDFAQCEINEAELLRRIVAQGQEVDPEVVMALFALSGASWTAPSLFIEKDYGYSFFAADSRSTKVVRNKIGTLEIQIVDGMDFTFTVRDTRSWGDVVEAAMIYAAKGEPICFEQQMSWATAGDGALASLVGARTITVDGKAKMMVSLGTDANKPEKLHARQKLGTGAVAKTIDDKGVSTVKPSGLMVKMSDGTYAVAYGTIVDCWISDSVFSAGSGVAPVRPGFTRTVMVQKTIRATINALYLAAYEAEIKKDLGDDVSRDQILREIVKRKLTVNRERLVYGDAVLTFDGRVYASWDNRGMEAIVIDAEPTIKVKAQSESVTISIKVAASYTDFAHKFRADGIKATGLVIPMTCIDSDGNWIQQPDILFTCEEIKGVHVALLRAWADFVRYNLELCLANGWVTPEDHRMGGVVYDANLGLSDAQKVALTKWRDAHSEIISVTPDDMDEFHARLIYKMVEKAKADPDYAKDQGIDPDAFIFNDDGTVTQLTRVVKCSMVLGIEVSTVRENITSQPMIGEMLLALKTIDPDLADAFWKAAKPLHKAVEVMADMALNQIRGETFTALDAFLEYDREKLFGRDLLEYFASKYEDGLTLLNHVGAPMLTIRFDALTQVGALLPGGSATGVALSVLELLEHLHVSRKGMTGWATHLDRLVRKTKSAAAEWVASDGIKSQVTRTKNSLAGRKVKTTYSKVINEDQIGINPHDPLVAEGKITEGDRMVIVRTPMISVFTGTVVLTELAPIGTYLVKAHLWSFGNEGDGDGDPAAGFVIRLSRAMKAKGRTLDDVKEAINKSPFGPMGYLMAHHGYQIQV